MNNNILKYKGYRARIEYDVVDRIFVGEVLGIRDVLAFHSETADDIDRHFHDCIDEYLELCAEIGKLPEREYSGTFNVRIDPEDHREAALCAAYEHISLNQYIAEAVHAFNKAHAELIA